MLNQGEEVAALELDERKLRILAAIVSQYIQSGEPVGSKTISAMNGIGVSPATVRNEMSALFDMGLLEQPHTSAGRVPSHLGYRVYIDRLMRCDPLTAREKDELDALFNVGDPDPDRLIMDATKRLSEYTGCAAVSATATAGSVFVSNVELIPADERTVVILVLASNGMIRNKICRVDFRVTRSICDFFQKFSNSSLRSRSLRDVTSSYVNAVAVSLGEYSRLFTPLLAAIYELCKEIYEGLYFYSGQYQLLGYGETRDAYNLMTLLDSRERMMRLLSDSADEIRVMIGRENRSAELIQSSVIVARYRISEDSAGLIAVIGPVRLPYARLIPHLEYFAETLGKLLTETYSRPNPDGNWNPEQTMKGDDFV